MATLSLHISVGRVNCSVEKSLKNDRKIAKMQDKQHTPLPLVEGVDIVESEQDFQLKNTIIAAISQNRTHSDRLMSDSSSLVTTTSYVLVTSSTVVVIYLFS